MSIYVMVEMCSLYFLDCDDYNESLNLSECGDNKAAIKNKQEGTV